MIAHHAGRVVVVDVTRVLIQQVLHLILAVHHQHQRYDGQLATGTRRQVADATAGIGLNGGNELTDVAALDGFARFGVHRTGIAVRRIVREVAADDKEVLVGEIRFQCLRNLLQLLEVVGRYDDRYDGWHFFSGE